MVHHGHRTSIIAGLHFNESLRSIPGVRGIYVKRSGKMRLFLNEAFWDFHSRIHPSAVVHETYYSNRNYRTSHPVVITVYDMIDELFPVAAARDNKALFKRHACNRADEIIAISEITKKDLTQLYNIAPNKITVVPLASWLPPSTSNARETDHPYLLYVGARWDYKNFHNLIEAFASSTELRERYTLVCFGGGEFTAAEREFFMHRGIAHRVSHRSGSDTELAECYRSATCLVHPSLYEGFGLTILEAMSQGCPVFCSKVPALEEVAAGAAEYFNPYDTTDIRRTLESGLGDSRKLLAISVRGKDRVAFFSWDKCYRETLKVYDRARS